MEVLKTVHCMYQSSLYRGSTVERGSIDTQCVQLSAIKFSLDLLIDRFCRWLDIYRIQITPNRILSTVKSFCSSASSRFQFLKSYQGNRVYEAEAFELEHFQRMHLHSEISDLNSGSSMTHSRFFNSKSSEYFSEKEFWGGRFSQIFQARGLTFAFRV